jgi:mRNA interferase MazF
MVINQYQIVLAKLEQDTGAVLRKTRPCVVISPDEMNRYLKTIVIAPLTRTPKTYPTRVAIRHEKHTGYIVVDQIMTVDRSSLIKGLGKLSQPAILRLKAVIRETYVE